MRFCIVRGSGLRAYLVSKLSENSSIKSIGLGLLANGASKMPDSRRVYDAHS